MINQQSLDAKQMNYQSYLHQMSHKYETEVKNKVQLSYEIGALESMLENEKLMHKETLTELETCVQEKQQIAQEKEDLYQDAIKKIRGFEQVILEHQEINNTRK